MHQGLRRRRPHAGCRSMESEKNPWVSVVAAGRGVAEIEAFEWSRCWRGRAERGVSAPGSANEVPDAASAVVSALPRSVPVGVEIGGSNGSLV